MSYREVMSLPIRSFWLLNSTIGRLLAEKDLRAITVQTARHGGDLMVDIRNHLTIELGETGRSAKQTPMNDERDQEGFNQLRRMSQLF